MIDYLERRQKFYQTIEEDGIILLYSGALKQLSYDASYPFVVNMNFYYLTGINQDEVYLLVEKHGNSVKETLYIYPNNPDIEKWIGAYLYPDEARKISSIENIKVNTEFNDDFLTLVQQSKNLYLDQEKTSFNGSHYFAGDFIDAAKEVNKKIKVHDIYTTILNFRSIKDEGEIVEIRNAIKATKEALESVMDHLLDLKTESGVQAQFEGYLMSNYCATTSFPTIAASGKNAAILHYHENKAELNKQEMILLDLGAKLNSYNADISRTYPLDGKYSELGLTIYKIVLTVNKLIINTAKPGLSIKDLQAITIKKLTELCLEASLIKEEKEIANYYFHNVSHHLGLDTHDPINRELVLKKGMVITVEPGLYFKELGIGVRIEDDILITENGAVNLSEEIIKEPEEIEKRIQANRK